jgi:hypothetical protein
MGASHSVEPDVSIPEVEAPEPEVEEEEEEDAFEENDDIRWLWPLI